MIRIQTRTKFHQLAATSVGALVMGIAASGAAHAQDTAIDPLSGQEIEVPAETAQETSEARGASAWFTLKPGGGRHLMDHRNRFDHPRYRYGIRRHHGRRGGRGCKR